MLTKIKNFFLKLFMVITSLIRSLFPKKEEKNKKTIITEEIKLDTSNTNKEIIPNTTTSNRDEPSTLENPHNSSSDDENESPNDKILEIPKMQINDLKTVLNNEAIIITDNIIDELIELALEEFEEHKKVNFKIKKATKEQEEKIKEFKERIVPKIKKQIYVKDINTKKELYTEIQDIVKEEIKLHPILPLPKEDKETKKENYFLASPLKKELNPKEIPKVKEETTLIKETTTEIKETIKEEIEEKPFIMVQNTPIKEPTIKDDLKNIAFAVGATAIKATAEVLSTPLDDKIETNKVPNIKEDKPAKIKKQEAKITALDLPELKQVEEKIKETKDSKERDKIKEDIEYIESKIEDKEYEINKAEEQQKPKEININLIPIINDVEEIEHDTETEMNKTDIEDKEYDRLIKQINSMLDDIENTYLRYEGKIPETQLRKLQAEEAKLRTTRENINNQKNIDISTEQSRLEELITDAEKRGLNKEIERLHLEHQIELNEHLIDDINKLDRINRSAAEEIEKKIVKKNMRKAATAATIGSVITFPFIRNRYFLFFAGSLMVGTHLNFISNLFRRKKSSPEDLDLSSIRKGKDALNEALGNTYDNITRLNIVEHDILTRYPEMAYDKEFVTYITRLRTNLDKNYNKLIRKKEVMQNYIYLGKQKKKMLKKEKRYES